MNTFLVKLHKQTVSIEKDVFLSLLDLSPIQEYKDYLDAVANNEISFENLKILALKAGVPYPLFFAPKAIVDKQLLDKEKNIFEKIPSKNEMRMSSRGKMDIKDIEVIIKDLSRKQEFLKTRILPKANLNTFIGSVAAKVKSNISIEIIATDIRDYLGINLSSLRNISKEKVLQYLCSCAESKDILISFSSANFMPQKINKEVEFSGICIKDKKFPYIFINTRDDEKKPKILETTGRQIFTLLTMLVYISMGEFILSNKPAKYKDDQAKKAFTIAGEILVPKNELVGISISNLDQLKEKAHFFRVTPSMLLYQLQANKIISVGAANAFRQTLSQEIKKAEPIHRHQPLQKNGYGKYNGERFSREIIRAYQAKAISQVEVKNILFRKNKMEPTLLQEYIQKYK